MNKRIIGKQYLPIINSVEFYNKYYGYIGIDLSYTNTGIAVIDKDGGYGSMSVSIKKTGIVKNKNNIMDLYVYGGVNVYVDMLLDYIRQEVSKVLFRGKDGAKCVIGIEIALFYGSRVYQIAMLVGTLYYGLCELRKSGLDVDIYTVNVSSIRKVFGFGSGKLSSKERKIMINNFWNKLGANCLDNDQSDAMSVAYYLFNQDRGGTLYFKEEVYGKRSNQIYFRGGEGC